jgi:predicted nucleic acid-binding protein
LRFWDSSAIVALLVDEARSADARALLDEDDAVAVWWAADVECVSALARLERAGAPAATIAECLGRLKAVADGWIVVLPSEEIRESAKRLLRVHPLRAPDALQLAAAIGALRGNAGHGDFVCLDERLCAAARREGLNVLPA